MSAYTEDYNSRYEDTNGDYMTPKSRSFIISLRESLRRKTGVILVVLLLLGILTIIMVPIIVGIVNSVPVPGCEPLPQMFMNATGTYKLKLDLFEKTSVYNDKGTNIANMKHRTYSFPYRYSFQIR
jgi:competence protein ComGC